MQELFAKITEWMIANMTDSSNSTTGKKFKMLTKHSSGQWPADLLASITKPDEVSDMHVDEPMFIGFAGFMITATKIDDEGNQFSWHHYYNVPYSGSDSEWQLVEIDLP